MQDFIIKRKVLLLLTEYLHSKLIQLYCLHIEETITTTTTTMNNNNNNNNIIFNNNSNGYVFSTCFCLTYSIFLPKRMNVVQNEGVVSLKTSFSVALISHPKARGPSQQPSLKWLLKLQSPTEPPGAMWASEGKDFLAQPSLDIVDCTGLLHRHLAFERGAQDPFLLW